MVSQLLRRLDPFRSACCVAFAAFMALALSQGAARGESLMKHPTFYRTDKGRRAFHLLSGGRAERCADAPLAARLSLIIADVRAAFRPRLYDHYHLVAPDYPGFGHSDWPDPKVFKYTFDHIASVMDDFTHSIGLSHYALYMQDYGGPVGFRMALTHPERVEALIVQDAVAHDEGLGELWKPRRAFLGGSRRPRERLSR